MKNYIGFSRDHSASMSHIARFAARDYNDNISAIREAAIAQNQDTIVSVVKCGAGRPAQVVREITNASVTALKPLDENHYDADGSSTPLFDSVGELIEMFKLVPDANEETTSFLIMVTTDGQENSSKRWNGHTVGEEIKRLQATDRWTFVFRVPRGSRSQLTRYGISDGNILEWDQTERGTAQSAATTREAFNQFYQQRTEGVKSTTKFYADLSKVSVAEVKASLKDISNQVAIWPVSSSKDGEMIRPFVEERVGANKMNKGSAFYQLTKSEKQVQDYKIICIREKVTGSVFSGAAARQMLGLPTSGTVKLEPGDHGLYDIFIQSTSVNRKLVGGTNLLYWPQVGVAFVADANTPAHQSFAPIIVAPITTNKIRLVRKNGGALVAEVDTMSEAQAMINKAKSGKKAALVIA